MQSTSRNLRIVGDADDEAPSGRRDDTIQRIVKLQTELAAMRQERDQLHDRVSEEVPKGSRGWLLMNTALSGTALAVSGLTLVLLLTTPSAPAAAPPASVALPTEPSPIPAPAPPELVVPEPEPEANTPVEQAPIEAAADEGEPAVQASGPTARERRADRRRRRAARRARRRGGRAARSAPASSSDDAIRGLESLSM